MTDIVDRVWHAYHLATVQVDHPLRVLCDRTRALAEENARLRERASKLDDEARRMLALARENGQLRDVAVRERDQANRDRDHARADAAAARSAAEAARRAAPDLLIDARRDRVLLRIGEGAWTEWRAPACIEYADGKIHTRDSARAAR